MKITLIAILAYLIYDIISEWIAETKFKRLRKKLYEKYLPNTLKEKPENSFLYMIQGTSYEEITKDINSDRYYIEDLWYSDDNKSYRLRGYVVDDAISRNQLKIQQTK